MHLLIELEECGRVAFLDSVLLTRNLLTQCFDLRARRALSRQAHGTAFDGFADKLAVGDGCELYRRNEGADLRHNGEQILFGETLNNFTHWRAADAMLLRQPRLG